MNNKIRKIVVIACFLIIVICFFTLTKPNKEVSYKYIDDVSIYLKDDNLVSNYSKFYTIENIVQDIVKDLNDNKFEEIYDITSKAFKNKYSLDYYNSKITSYLNDNFKMSPEGPYMDLDKYKNLHNLDKLYKKDKNEYIARVKSLKGYTNIGICLIDDTNYIITFLDI